MSLWLLICLSLIVLPAIGSGLLRLASSHEMRTEQDERRVLWVMLSPIVIGVMVIAAASIWPSPPAGSPNFVALASSGAVIADAPTEVVNLQREFQWLWSLVVGVLVLGSAFHIFRVVRAHFAIRRVVRRAQSDEEKDDVLYTPEIVPPFAALDRWVVIPSYLQRCLASEELAPIITHERMHNSRRDGRWFTVLAVIDAALWYNPFILRQTARCRIAAELAVDQVVVTTHPGSRKIYAESLITVLKHTAGTSLRGAPAIFSTREHGEAKMRIEKIMRGQPKPPKQKFSLSMVAAVVAVPLALGQLALAATYSRLSADFIMMPIEARISSEFGVLRDEKHGLSMAHRGVDFAAPTGTTIIAPAAGKVIYANRKGAWGLRIDIDHGEKTQTVYAHLNAISVKVGEDVHAGQKIGEVGSTGRSTRPHLHFEVVVDGSPVDPMTVLPSR